MYILRRRPGLLALKVAFASIPGDLKIDYTLERFEQEQLVFQKSWRRDMVATPDECGGHPDRVPLLRLPAELPDSLAEAVAATGASAPEPLWLHLVKPYGMLGIAGWEQALTATLNRPVFRLPDFLARPCEFEDVLECAILWDHPLDAVDPAMLDAAIAAWLDGSRRATVRLHVLATDPPVRERLATRWRDRADAVIVCPPDQTLEPAMPGDAIAPFAWIERATQGITLDVLQLAAAAELGPAASTLMLRGDAPDRPLPCAGVAELATLLNRLGAWCTVISGLPASAGEPALRHFGDALAQARPGPVLYHALAAAPDEDLLTTCDVLFSSGEIDPPALRHGFLYCTPALVRASLVEQAAGPVPSAPANELLAVPWPTAEQAAEAPGQPPPWVAAAQRVVEEITLDHSRSVAGDNLLQNLLQQAPEIAQSLKETRAEDAVQQAIDDVQAIIRQAAVQSVAAQGRTP